MLIKCPECELMVSDKAAVCPHCGYPMSPKAKRERPSTKRHRLPNGFGQISKIKGKNLRRPYRAMVPAGVSESGHPVSKLLKPQAYFETYNDAYMALVEYNKNPYDPSRAISFPDLYKEWFDKKVPTVKNPATLRQYNSSYQHLTKLYKYNIRELRSYHLREAIEKEDCSIQLKDKMKTLLNMLFDYAVEHEYVDRNYARDLSINISRPDRSDIHKAYTEDELKVLWQNINEPSIFAQVFQCFTGFRPDETLKIKLSDIDFEKKLIKGGEKTEAGTDRLVPIHESFLPVLQEKYNAAADNGYMYLIYGIGRQKEKDLPIRYDSYRDVLHKRFEFLGLNHHPHDGRVTFVTLAKKYNVDEYAIKYIVGHKIKDLTERVYTKREIEWLQKELAKIPSGEIFGFEK